LKIEEQQTESKEATMNNQEVSIKETALYSSPSTAKCTFCLHFISPFVYQALTPTRESAFTLKNLDQTLTREDIIPPCPHKHKLIRSLGAF
jgi:hypothetical protein